jgi:hypothetical protein
MITSMIINGKRQLLAALMALMIPSLFMVCSDNNLNNVTIDTEAPPVPTGVTSTTMNQSVLVSWDPIYLDRHHNDLEGFKVYKSDDNQNFDFVARTDPSIHEYLVEGLENGRTYYFAVSSFDHNNNESDLSYETVFDTPRPEGFNVHIYTYNSPSYQFLSGFDLSTQTRLQWDSPSCDFYLEYDTTSSTHTFYLWLGQNGAFAQDMGYTNGFDDITFAPEIGWSRFSYMEAIAGHTYVILTNDNHYAKVRIDEFVSDPTYGIIFDWAYQVAPGNRELRITPPTIHNLDSNTKAEVR